MKHLGIKNNVCIQSDADDGLVGCELYNNIIIYSDHPMLYYISYRVSIKIEALLYIIAWRKVIVDGGVCFTHRSDEMVYLWQSLFFSFVVERSSNRH